MIALLILTAAAGIVDIRPEVHSVTTEGDYLVIRSAGISRVYLGPLQANPDPSPRVREYEFRLPRAPHAAVLRHPGAPPDIRGVFFNGVPIRNQFQSSYQGQNLWHYDPLAIPGAHGNAPGLLEELSASRLGYRLIGYALDGFPVYSEKLHSSYQLRKIAARDTLPDGTQLTPAQYGPAIDGLNPLGRFAEDYEYIAGSGDLDEFNGRLTADHDYAYFVSTGYPYLLANRYYGDVPRSTPAAWIASREGLTLRADSARPRAGDPVRLSFTAPATLENVHERPIHLLIVAEDLAEFAHVHPEVNGDAYEIAYTFAHGGHYRAYADFTPAGSSQRIAAFDFDVEGDRRAPKRLRAVLTPGVTLKAGAPLRAGRDIPLRLSIADRTGMEPYLGAWSHFVVIQGRLGSFQHLHPISEGVGMAHCAMATGAPPAEVRTVVKFPAPGSYKLWAQFQRRGEVITVPFVVKVGP